jgi:transcriptional regulator with XRE-family HTH domain
MPLAKPVASPSHLALAEAIRAARKRAGYKNQEVFAREIGLDRSYYSEIEGGKSNITIGTMLKITDGAQNNNRRTLL